MKFRGRILPWCFLLAFFAWSGAAFSNNVSGDIMVSRIDIAGNKKTKHSIILQEIIFRAGQSVNQDSIDQSVQAIKNLGLFQSVEYHGAEADDGTIVATFTVVEKRFNFVLPKLNRNGDGDITTGIVWRSENLFGRNQRSKFTLARKQFDDADEETENEIKWEYDYPRIAQSPFSLSLVALSEDTRLEETVNLETGEYDRSRSLFQFLLGRRLRKSGPSHGITLSAGPLWDRYRHEFISGTPGLLPDVTVKAIVAKVDGFYVNDHLLSRSGHHFGYNIRVADDVISSDVNFVDHFFFYRKFIPLPGKEHTNLNYQFRVGTINRSILGPPQFKVGGSRSLRGYARDDVEGNAFAILNVEYLRPIFNRETLRGALLFDVGNAWERANEASLSDLKYSVGVGLRWKLKRFVRTDVRLDIARGISEGGETRAYLSTRATF